MLEISYFARHTKISDRFRDVFEKKVKKIENIGFDTGSIKVELSHENNPRLVDISEKVELTLSLDSELLRAESSDSDIYSALDKSIDKLVERLRRIIDRKKTLKNVKSKHMLVAESSYLDAPKDIKIDLNELKDENEFYLNEDSPIIIRKKVHKESPMTLEEAIYRLELIDHDFFIFVDKKTNRPSVVYRRRGWSYGVLELEG